MRSKVITNMEVQTSEGSTTLKEDQVIKLSKEEAIPLINEGKITPFEKVAYRIYSNILQAYLWVTADDKDRETIRASLGVSEALYTSDEIKKLKGLSKDSLREIHKVKEIFENSKIKESRCRTGKV